MVKGFQIPQAELGATTLFCQYLNMGRKTKPCKQDPKTCFLGNKGFVNEDGTVFTPIEQPDTIATLRNCPKINQ